MFAFIVRRIIQAILVMLVIGLVGFVIQHQIGDPVRDLVGERVTPAEREVIRDRLGLNDPFYNQYFRFVKNASRLFHGGTFTHSFGPAARRGICARRPGSIRSTTKTRPAA